VIRQEDIGVDFHCALARQEGRKLTFHSPYLVQVGSVGSKAYRYGGTHDDKSQEWRKWEIEWLFAQDLPLLVCTVDRARGQFCLYSTSAIWHAYYESQSLLGAVELLPDEVEPRPRENIPSHCGDGFCYFAPLRRPVVELTIADLEDGQTLRA
jgi:hypothetical protein